MKVILGLIESLIDVRNLLLCSHFSISLHRVK